MDHNRRARLLYKEGKHQQSAEHFRAWLQRNPADVHAQHDLSASLFALGDLEAAEEAAKHAATIDPNYAKAWVTLATIQAARGQLGTPLTSMLAATRIDPENLHYRVRLGTMLLDQNQLEHAVQIFDGVLKKTPNHIDAIGGLATVLERQGKLNEAHDLMEPHVHTVPVHARLGATWGTVSRRLGQYQRGVDVLVRMLAHKVSPIAQAMMLAELGALYDKMNQTDAAFAAYTEANLRRQGTWDPVRLEKWVDRMIETFSAELFQTAPRGANHSQRPILIVGMPRSGTSLVEQILAAHPEVHGAGELEDMRVTSLFAEARSGTSFPECISTLSPALTTQLGAWYLDRRVNNAPTHRWVTDKMPQNFQFIGLATLLMPGVNIVHCVRDPMDTILSCYFQGFKAALAWSNRLEWLGPYCVQYRRLMAHWESVLPQTIHHVQYESLVADPDATIRALLAHCGIEFDPAVLAHHTNDRRIVTASYAQANRPIYQSSTGKAVPYAKHLASVRSLLETP